MVESVSTDNTEQRCIDCSREASIHCDICLKPQCLSCYKECHENTDNSAQEHSLSTTIEYIKQLHQIVPNVNNRYKVNKLSTHAH